MSEIERLEQRVGLLEEELMRLRDRAAIENLRHKYWRCMRHQLSDEIMDCFAEDEELDFGRGMLLKGTEELKQYYKGLFESTGRPRLIPQGHNPEISITGNRTAEAIWLLDVLNALPGADTGTRIGVQYDETYLKNENRWRIKTIKNHYLYYQQVKLIEEP